jgi:predicted transcriptional regulator
LHLGPAEFPFQFLAELGLITLKEEGRRKTLIPMVRFDGIEVDLGDAA